MSRVASKVMTHFKVANRDLETGKSSRPATVEQKQEVVGEPHLVERDLFAERSRSLVELLMTEPRRGLPTIGFRSPQTLTADAGLRR